MNDFTSMIDMPRNKKAAVDSSSADIQTLKMIGDSEMFTPKSRNPPAYQEYASDVLANLSWRMMTFAERGLLDTLRKECWVNKTIPSDPEKLSRLLCKDLNDIKIAMTPMVLESFQEYGGWLICPELEAYRAHLEKRHLKLSEGGSRGGKKTQKLAKKSREESSLNSEDDTQATLQGRLKPLRREEENRREKKPSMRTHQSSENAERFNDYELGFNATGVKYGEHRS